MNYSQFMLVAIAGLLMPILSFGMQRPPAISQQAVEGRQIDLIKTQIDNIETTINEKTKIVEQMDTVDRNRLDESRQQLEKYERSLEGAAMTPKDEVKAMAFVHIQYAQLDEQFKRLDNDIAQLKEYIKKLQAKKQAFIDELKTQYHVEY